MKENFFKKTAAFILAMCILSGGLPQATGRVSLLKPNLTADAADSTVSFDEETGALILSGNINKDDVIAYADNEKVKTVYCKQGAVLPADSSELFEFFLAEEFDLSNADTSNVTDMNFMFYCSFAKTIDLTGWDTSKVTNMNYMFSDCTKLETIYVSSKWVVAEETTTAGTFDSCTSLTGEKGTTVDTSLLDYAEFARIDGGEEAPGYFSHNVHEWGEWEVTKEATATETGLKERTCSVCGEKETEVIPATGEAHEHTWGEPTYTWNEDYSKCTAERVCSECGEKETETVKATSEIKSSGYIFYTAEFTNPAFETQEAYKSTTGLPSVVGTYTWYPDGPLTKELVRGMSQDRSPAEPGPEVESIVAVEGCVLPKDCSYLFEATGHPLDWRCLKSIDLSKADFSQVENMEHMFYCLPALTTVIIDEADLSKVKDISFIFDSENIRTVVIKANKKGTPALKSMKTLFPWRSNNLTNLTMSGFTTENVISMSGLFAGCSSLDNADFIDIDLNFDTSKVNDMSGMFADCSGITKLDLSSFDTSSVENMSEMFSGCENLKKITVGNGWNTEKVDESENMFLDCTSIKGLNGTVYDPDHIDAEYARVDTNKNPGYFTTDRVITAYPAKAATCEEDGNIAYWYDKVTDTYYTDEALTKEITAEETVIPALGHKWGEWEIVTEATYTKEGLKKRVCTVCGKEETEVIPVLVSTEANLVIKQIDKVTAEILADETNIEKLGEYVTAARVSYDDLLDGEKELITNYNALLIAEKFYKVMKANGDSTAVQAEPKIGDVDSDGTVDTKDAMLFTRYYNGDESVTIDLRAADLDRDGEVTLRDVMILTRYVNGWEGYDTYIVDAEI